LARKILLADDSVTAQNMGRRILSDAGYDVTTVNNGSAALKKIAESLPELIVLDVYMPGYSGLEVCQRLKETRETARIPVLLTVGKLEPFKPEDARRARADAFIVKPFEASELLTALTKLEDKIVPQPTGKPGQFAKVWAELEQGEAPAKTEKFGDAETGWKNRLTIPAPGSKHEEPEAEEVSTKASGKSKKDKGKEKKVEDLKPLEVKAPVAETSAVGVPADITPEEVAAIAAAAAAFEEKNPSAEFAVKKSEVAEEPAPVASAMVQPEAVETKPVEAKAEAPEAVKESPALTAETETKEAEPAAGTTVPEPTAAAKEAAPEVVVPEVGASEMAPASAVAPVTEAAGPSTAEKPSEIAPAPKWVAKEIPLPPEETGISLEQEMEKATAVLQAATAMVDLSGTANATVSESTAVPVEAEAQAGAPPVETKAEVEPGKEEQVAGPTPSAEPEGRQEPAAVVGSQPEVQPAVVTAVAAAASAGPSTPENMPEAVSPPVSTPVSNEAGSAPEAKANESELAAAWAQWKQIRETVVGSQLTSQIADVAAAELKNSEPVEASEQELAPAEKPSGNPTAIASIVDSVLAELKPKLVEEIARKLGDEKGKKKK
jgi:twitching motility two-component system response regulator PilH